MTEAGSARPSTSALTIRARLRSANSAATGAMSAAARKLAPPLDRGAGWLSIRPVCRQDVSVPAEVAGRQAGDMTAVIVPVRPARILAVMCGGMFLVLLDVTIVNVALPRISARLDLGVAALQWVVDGYAVAIASLLLAGGSLGDRLGHRRLLLAGFALFGLASIVCAAAPNGAVLVAGRVGQGVGGALLLPCT